MGQLYGIAELSPLAPLAPAILNYPLAPHNDQAAGFMNCVNNSPFDPIANQQNGTVLANLNPTVPNAPSAGSDTRQLVAGGLGPQRRQHLVLDGRRPR
jgi:hypothetical protein